MARISPIELAAVDPAIRAVLEAQAKKWGQPLVNHMIYARRPTIYRAVRGMWAGLDASGLIGRALTAIVNRRVAGLNGCVF